jgi:hypothetical protein
MNPSHWPNKASISDLRRPMKLWRISLHTWLLYRRDVSTSFQGILLSKHIGRVPLPHPPTSTVQTSGIHIVCDIAAVILSEYAKVKPRCLGDHGKLTWWGNAEWTSLQGH